MICARDSSAILHFTFYILHLKGQNLAEAALTGRWNEEPGNPERIPARYAIAENAAKADALRNSVKSGLYQ